MSSSIKKGFVDAINAFATPQSVASTVLKQICLSEYTLDSIRGLIIDPIKSKFVPKEIASSMDDFEKDLWTLLFMCKEKVTRDIFQFTNDSEVDEIIDYYKKDPEDAFYYKILYRTPDYTAKAGGKTIVIPYKGAFLYVYIQKDTREWTFYLSIHFVGPNAFNVQREFNQIKEDVVHWIDVESKSEKFRKIMVVSENSRGMLRSSSSTVPNTIIVDHVQKELDEIIEMVSRSENLEDEFGINKTIGILLHGPHGTGKSTIARYLALTLGRVLILTTSDNLMNAMDYVQNHSSSRKFILLIEDIDFMFTDRRKKKPTRAKKAEENEEASSDDDMNKRTSLLFQVLDGVLSNSNLIVIATTNYFDRLDPALVRDGRFDYKIELKGLDYETAAKVCERFAVTPEEIDLSSWKLPIAPATLQTVLLRYKVTNKNTYDPEKLTDNGEEN
jgi:hypothetical protein